MRTTGVSFPDYKTSIVDLRGGINENVSSIELASGELIDCKNYMIAEGGYGGYISTKGYERIDGSIIPSEYISYRLILSDVTQIIQEGSVLTGSNSGATFITLEEIAVADTAEVQCRTLVGTYELGEDIEVSSTIVASLSQVTEVTGGTEDNHLALDYARSAVQEVPGEGAILGLHIFENTVYAFRKETTGNTVGLYAQSSSGWSQVDTSSDPIVYDSTGHDFKFVNYNFYATTGSYSMFWVDGVNQARMYDGYAVTTIDNTGMGSDDNPINIAAHNYHLFLAYSGGSLQFSGLGDPTIWDGVLGASEIGVGDDITNLVAGVSSSLLIFLRNGIRVLSGNSIDDFILEVFSDTSGAFNRTAERLLGTVFFVDDRGLSTLDAVQEYGDYGANSISQRFKQTLLNNKHTITTTSVSRDLNQYRIFFDDRTAIYVSFEGKEFAGATFMEFPHDLNVTATGQTEEKRDLTVFAPEAEEGYVYLLDSGTSFDGEEIICRLTTAFYHYGSPRSFKGFKKATIELNGAYLQNFDLRVDFDYREAEIPDSIWYSPTIYTITGNAFYGSSRWGEMIYGGTAATNRTPVYLQGIGTNMSYKLISRESYEAQHIVQNIITDYELLGRRI